MKTRIRELREEKNISQTKLALQIGVTQSTLSKIENEQCIPDAELIVRMARHFHVTTDYILCQSDHRFPIEVLTIEQVSNLYPTALSDNYNLNHAQLSALHNFLINFVGSSL
ncbi:MAG: helix-turn-helix transcriptional regulator [Lachnospiraceae bacterium]|nr:helix-turn-helix transcriptional regulator [Lachnospiraceae bacterium]